MSVYWKYDLCPSTIFHTSSTCIWKIWSRVSNININIYIFLKYILKSNKHIKFSVLQTQYRYSSCIFVSNWSPDHTWKVCSVFFHQKGLWLQELYLYCICNAVLKLNVLSLLIKVFNAPATLIPIATNDIFWKPALELSHDLCCQ